MFVRKKKSGTLPPGSSPHISHTGSGSAILSTGSNNSLVQSLNAANSSALGDAEFAMKALLAPNEQIRKQALFKLRHQLRDENFTLQFIHLDGMSALINSVSGAEGNVLGYALSTLEFALSQVKRKARECQESTPTSSSSSPALLSAHNLSSSNSAYLSSGVSSMNYDFYWSCFCLSSSELSKLIPFVYHSNLAVCRHALSILTDQVKCRAGGLFKVINEGFLSISIDQTNSTTDSTELSTSTSGNNNNSSSNLSIKSSTGSNDSNGSGSGSGISETVQRSIGEGKYCGLVSLINSSEYSIQLNSLSLVNFLLQNSPNPENLWTSFDSMNIVNRIHENVGMENKEYQNELWDFRVLRLMRLHFQKKLPFIHSNEENQKYITDMWKNLYPKSQQSDQSILSRIWRLLGYQNDCPKVSVGEVHRLSGFAKRHPHILQHLIDEDFAVDTAINHVYRVLIPLVTNLFEQEGRHGERNGIVIFDYVEALDEMFSICMILLDHYYHQLEGLFFSAIDELTKKIKHVLSFKPLMVSDFKYACFRGTMIESQIKNFLPPALTPRRSGLISDKWSSMESIEPLPSIVLSKSLDREQNHHVHNLLDEEDEELGDDEEEDDDDEEFEYDDDQPLFEEEILKPTTPRSTLEQMKDIEVEVDQERRSRPLLTSKEGVRIPSLQKMCLDIVLNKYQIGLCIGYKNQWTSFESIGTQLWPQLRCPKNYTPPVIVSDYQTPK